MKSQKLTLTIDVEHDLEKDELELATRSAYEGAMKALAGFSTSTGHYVRNVSQTA